MDASQLGHDHFPTPRRRLIAVLVTLAVGPGIGHFLRGRPARGLAWFGGSELIQQLSLLSSVWLISGMWVALALAVLLRLAAAADAALVSVPGSGLPRWGRAAGSAFLLVLVGLGLSELRKSYLVEAFKIPSGSMVPTLLPGDHLFARKLGFEPRRGDVVIFRYPEDESKLFIQRIVAMGGDTVAMVNGDLQLNGRAIGRKRADVECTSEDFDELSGEVTERTCVAYDEGIDGRRYRVIRDPAVVHPSSDMEPIKVPAGHAFVLGDNRDHSSDSRYWATVSTVGVSKIVGVATFIWWSSGPSGVRWERLGRRVNE